MEEARTVLRRLGRIEALEREGAHAPALLAELRALMREAEQWLGAEGTPQRARAALERCQNSLQVKPCAVEPALNGTLRRPSETSSL
jgi:hypothetical protein